MFGVLELLPELPEPEDPPEEEPEGRDEELPPDELPPELDGGRTLFDEVEPSKGLSIYLGL